MPAETDIIAVEVNRGLLKELEDLGFSTARAAWALHHSGNFNLETAVNWIIDHENDSQFDNMPVVEFNIEIESPNPSESPPELKLVSPSFKHERIRAGRQMTDAEEIERKRKLYCENVVGNDEEKKARDKILHKVNADKRVLKSSAASKAEEMRECLRSLRRNHKDEDPKITRGAFETLLLIVSKAAANGEKYRRIRLTNRLFQERVGRFKKGMEFLELCGFKKEEGSEFLYLSTHDADILHLRLREAAIQLQSAITNPFFGLLSKEVEE